VIFDTGGVARDARACGLGHTRSDDNQTLDRADVLLWNWPMTERCCSFVNSVNKRKENSESIVRVSDAGAPQK